MYVSTYGAPSRPSERRPVVEGGSSTRPVRHPLAAASRCSPGHIDALCAVGRAHATRRWSMADDRLALMAHLLRRAGFGASREELEEYAARPYEEVVEDLLHPERFPEPEDDILARYYPNLANQDNPPVWN